MAINVSGATGTLLEVEANDKNQARVSVVTRGNGFSFSASTGTMTAGLAANAAVFAMRLDTGTGAKAYIDRVRWQFTTIAAFTTPITAGRSLTLYRGAGANASGGTGLPEPMRKHTASTSSEFSATDGGDARIATTGALGVVGITFESAPIRMASLVHVGTAGAHYETIWEFADSECSPVVIEPGELLAIRNGPNAMGAAGTWQLTLTVDWREWSGF